MASEKNGGRSQNESGQSILDFVLVFIAIAVLSVGIVRIWVWFNANYAGRQVAYQTSRVVAGRPNLGNFSADAAYGTTGQTPKNAPLDIGATPDCPSCKYAALNLNEEWLFKGTSSGVVPPPPGASVYDPEQSAQACQTQCVNQPGCGTIANFNVECPCYVHCLCNAQIQPQIQMYDSLMAQLGTQVQSMLANAQSMRDRADECDDPWEICWWAGFGAVARQLNRAADQLENAANSTIQIINQLAQDKQNLINCCNMDTTEEQDICLDSVSVAACQQLVSYNIQTWNADIAARTDIISHLTIEVNSVPPAINTCNNQAYVFCSNLCSGQCYTQCSNSCQSSCTIQCTYPDYPGGPAYLHQTCYNNCYASCYPACYTPCYNACYPPCYTQKRNECCQTFYCSTNSEGEVVFCCLQGQPGCFVSPPWAPPWNRMCDTPATACDEDCQVPGVCPGCDQYSPPNDPDCIKCGLSVMAGRSQQEIIQLQGEIADYNAKIAAIQNCCSFPTPIERTQCIIDASNATAP